MTLQSLIHAFFAACGLPLADVPILQPADPFLDTAGEDLRRRIFLTESESGAQLCLRPEFTIPVCLDHIATQSGTPRRYAYLGEVFRQQRDGRSEFLQAGIEDLGETDRASADARSLADAHALLTEALPDGKLAVTLGDQAVFEAVLAALGLPRGWQKRLARAFGSASALESALADLQNPPKNGGLSGEASLLVAAGNHDALVAYVAAGMEEAGLPPTTGRTAAEIAARLTEKASLRQVRLPREAFDALRRFLEIRVPLDSAADMLSDFAGEVGLSLDEALNAFAARADAIGNQGLAVRAITYDAAFGRPLDYYTGLVFEVGVPGDTQPLAGGGRYDRLLTLLGAEKPIPGVGFSVWLDRIEAAR